MSVRFKHLVVTVTCDARGCKASEDFVGEDYRYATHENKLPKGWVYKKTGGVSMTTGREWGDQKYFCAKHAGMKP